MCVLEVNGDREWIWSKNRLGLRVGHRGLKSQTGVRVGAEVNPDKILQMEQVFYFAAVSLRLFLLVFRSSQESEEDLPR